MLMDIFILVVAVVAEVAVEVEKSHLEQESKKKQRAYLLERKISPRIITLQVATQNNSTNPQTPTQVSPKSENYSGTNFIQIILPMKLIEGN